MIDLDGLFKGTFDAFFEGFLVIWFMHLYAAALNWPKFTELNYTIIQFGACRCH